MTTTTAHDADANSPSLKPLREAVARLQRGRPRKLPPVPVPADMKYCFACRSVLALATFAIDRQQPDGKKLDCRACDNVARVARRRARLKLQLAA